MTFYKFSKIWQKRIGDHKSSVVSFSPMSIEVIKLEENYENWNCFVVAAIQETFKTRKAIKKREANEAD